MKKILIISSFFLVLISISTIGYQIVSANEQVDEIKDQIITQHDQESYLTPYGYTLDNPNIVQNPYGISPLTALILFETDTKEEVTVIVKGKDANSTYTNTFKSDTKHYIPIYGLYPNVSNQIHLKCGNITKTYTIKTEPLPSDFKIKEIENNSNNLYFITTDNYPYALDSNNEVRWYLTKNYSKKITRLENGNFLLSTDTINSNNLANGLIEIDLLGKIYKQYNLEYGYYGSYAETPTSIFVLSKNLLEIDKQSGTILNEKKLSSKYNAITYDSNSNTINLSNEKELKKINLTTKTETVEPFTTILNEQEIELPLYNTNENYKLTKGIKFTTNTKTPESSKTIFLVNYKKIDEIYKNYNIKITKTSDYLEVSGFFAFNDKVYLILDKFLDKRIYDIKSNHTTINKKGLSGKYSIYIKINNTIYKTNTYVTF